MASRIGFPVKVLGAPGLKSNDSRRHQSNPHLRVSIECLHAIFDYLERHAITMYRMSSEIAPYLTHPDLPQFHNQISESARELRQLGVRVRCMNLRLSFHPSQYVVMNAPDPVMRDKSIWDLRTQAEILDAMELNAEAVLVIHVGGAYDDRGGDIHRWVGTYARLPEPARRRLVLENDDIRFSAADVLRIHERTGVPLVFDIHHHQYLNPERLDALPTLKKFLASWPGAATPNIHFSSSRTEMRPVVRTNRKTGKKQEVLMPPIWTGHADYIHPFDFIRFASDTAGLMFDIMLEAKAKDLALLRLRKDILQYAPELAARFEIGLDAAAAAGDAKVEVAADAL